VKFTFSEVPSYNYEKLKKVLFYCSLFLFLSSIEKKENYDRISRQNNQHEGPYRHDRLRHRVGLLRHHGRRRCTLPQGRPQVYPEPPHPALVERGPS
jgi:hypothetical protein